MNPLNQSSLTRLSASMYRWTNRVSPPALSMPIDFLVSELEPLFAAKRMAAELVSKKQETHDATTFLLRPSVHWQGFVPGQYIALEVEIEGVRYCRNYSISSSVLMFEKEALISITVKRVEDGLVSNYLADNLEPNALLHISEARGAFIMDTVPKSQPTTAGQNDAPLFVAAGSGITPIMSMIESLAVRNLLKDAVLIYATRSPEDVIFEQRLMQLKTANPGFVVIKHFSTEASGHLNQQYLAKYCPDLSLRTVYTCGPEGFMSTVKSATEALGVDASAVKSESFGSPRHKNALAHLTQARGEAGTAGSSIMLAKTQQTLTATGEKTLLEIAEHAGLKPKFGCRIGVCHECKCTKTSGRVMNTVTGELVSEEQRQIQACISIPVGDVEIENW